MLLILRLLSLIILLPISYNATGMEPAKKRSAAPISEEEREAKRQKLNTVIDNINSILDILQNPNIEESQKAEKAREKIASLLENKQLPGWNQKNTKQSGWESAQKDLEDPQSIEKVKGKIAKVRDFQVKQLEQNRNLSSSTSQSITNIPYHHSNISNAEGEHNSYALQSPGPEEKWRWRNNFKVLCQVDSEHPPLSIDFAPLHQKLTLIKNGIEDLDTAYFRTDNCNVIVPAISIVYETLNGQLMYKTGYIPNISPRGIRENNSVVFLSGLGARKLPENYEAAGQNFQLTMGVIELESLMKQKLLEFYKIHDNDHDNFLNGFKLFITELINESQSFTKECNFGTYFYHTEQWFSFYLFLDYQSGKRINYGNLCTAISHILTPIGTQIKKIHQIIFHLASKHDICDICSPTLSIFLENLHIARPGIIQLLKNRLPGSLENKDEIISPELGFFIIASSDRADLNQARLRKFYVPNPSYEHGNRRNNFGRDQSIDSEIVISKDTPYKYIQVPVDRNGNPIHLE